MGRKDARIDTETKRDLAHNPFGALASLASKLPAGPAAGAPTADLAAEATRPRDAKPEAVKGRVVLRRETKHRGGKTVVVASGFENVKGVDDEALAAMAAELKRSLGCGGTVEDGPTGKILVIQGDQPARVAELLRSKGLRVDGVTR